MSDAEAPLDAAATRALVQPLYAGKALRTGEPFIAHADGIAAIVATLRPDPDLLVAAQLFGVYDVLRDPDEWLRSRFGAGVAQLVADLRQLMRLSELTRSREEARGREQPGRPGRGAATDAAGDGERPARRAAAAGVAPADLALLRAQQGGAVPSPSRARRWTCMRHSPTGSASGS